MQLRLSRDADEKKDDSSDAAASTQSHESRRGLLKMLIYHYSSTPITEQSLSASADNGNATTANHKRLGLTASERQFLHDLVQTGTVESIDMASLRLADLMSIPPADDDIYEHDETCLGESSNAVRRNSMLQQELFRLHETQNMVPSRVLQHMVLVHRNSILDDADDAETAADLASLRLAAPTDEVSLTALSNVSASSDWNAFKDISSWVDGGVGVEVTQDSGVVTKTTELKAPFKILGTTADDVSCHPHVLSPPLMESLLAFLPESLTDFNFFLKYSLVRDGASLWTLHRNTRASTNCFLAIETTEGHVFGAFTSQNWRMSQGWYGTKDSFLFKMRHSRLEQASSILQQVSNESEIQVYPYRSGNASLQHCSTSGIMMGQGELLPATGQGDYLGYALYLEPSLKKGSTSTSETFGNPCLISADLRGSTFDVSNIEVWSLTPHMTVEDAERAELSTLFLASDQKNLNLMDIIVGGTI